MKHGLEFAVIDPPARIVVVSPETQRADVKTELTAQPGNAGPWPRPAPSPWHVRSHLSTLSMLIVSPKSLIVARSFSACGCITMIGDSTDKRVDRDTPDAGVPAPGAAGTPAIAAGTCAARARGRVAGEAYTPGSISLRPRTST